MVACGIAKYKCVGKYSSCCRTPSLFVDGIKVLVQDFIHGEHMHFVHLENRPHAVITNDHASIGRVLKTIRFNILPDSFDSLWPRELGFAQQFS